MAEQLNLLRAADVENQGVVLGTALGLKDLGNGLFVQAIGPQTINRFRGDGHQLPLLNQIRRNGGRFRGLGGQKQGFHRDLPPNRKQKGAAKTAAPGQSKITRWAGWQPR